MEVREVMTEAVVTDSPQDSLRSAASRMWRQQAGSLVVVDNDQLLGIITERDILRAVALGADPDKTTVDDVMTAEVFTAAPDMPLPGNAYPSPSPDIPPPADGITVPAYQRQAPPYPAQVPHAATPSISSRITAPFAALTRPKPKRPARPKPVVPSPPPSRATVAPRPAPRPADQQSRRAQLVLSRIEPWSVMKFSFMVSLVGWVVLFVSVAALCYALRTFGVFHYLEQSISTVTSSKGHVGSNAQKWFSASTVLGYTMLAGAINVILFTAIATVGSVVYNLVTHLSGGVEVTLREAD